jgi:hypothetical protein
VGDLWLEMESGLKIFIKPLDGGVLFIRVLCITENYTIYEYIKTRSSGIVDGN